MPLNLDRLALRLLCPRCKASGGRALKLAATTAIGEAAHGFSPVQRLICGTCGAEYPTEDGVLVLTGESDDPQVASEREAALRTEHDAALGGHNDPCEDMSRAEGAFKEAILALPYGDRSRYYAEPGYFRNVQTSVARFDFILRHLGAKAGERLLDLGADCTWTTSHFARRGLDCTAVDVSHRLPVAHLFERSYGISYDLVLADMTTVPFADNTFDIVLAVDALHHGSDLGALARNIARLLAPGGRLAFAEPYCRSAEEKAAFGREQIDAGISEHTYLLEEWHRAFAQAGLMVRTHRVAESFAAIYEKPRAPLAGDPGMRGSLEDLFAGFYDGRLTVLADPPSRVRPGEIVRVALRLENRGRHTWCTNSRYLVRASYHVYAEAGDLVSWDNRRTPLPSEIAPGDATTMTLEVTAPAEPGGYVIEIDMLHEYVSWFASKGLASRRVAFTVVR